MKTSQPPASPDAEREKQDRQLRKTIVGQHVIKALGQPVGLHRVQVRHLWDVHYRVNVFVGVDAVSATIAHSYFLVTDGTGNIIASTPTLRRHYEPGQ